MNAAPRVDAVLLFYDGGVLRRYDTTAVDAVCSPVDAAITALRADKATVVLAGDLAALLEALGVSETVEEMS